MRGGRRARLACVVAGVLAAALAHAKPPAAWKPAAAAPPAAAGSPQSDAGCGDAPAAARPLGTGPLARLDAAAVDIPVLGAPSRGPGSARVTAVVFSDFQCPSCRQAHAALDSLAKAFPRELRVVFKQYPLSFHPYAFAAAEAACAAHDQGRFWELADVIYAHQEELDQDALMGWACEVGLDVRAFSKGLYGGRFKGRVRLDMADGDRIGVRGTPMVYLNGHAYLGRRTLAEMKPVVRALLDARPGATPVAGAPGGASDGGTRGTAR